MGEMLPAGGGWLCTTGSQATRAILPQRRRRIRSHLHALTRASPGPGPADPQRGSRPVAAGEARLSSASRNPWEVTPHTHRPARGGGSQPHPPRCQAHPPPRLPIRPRHLPAQLRVQGHARTVPIASSLHTCSVTRGQRRERPRRGSACNAARIHSGQQTDLTPTCRGSA